MFITALSIAFTMQSCAQESDSKSAPEKVLTSFSAKFPDAKKVEWEMENNENNED